MTMWNADHFRVGDWFTCVYNDKPRECEVTELPPRRDYMQVRTADGYRNLKYYKLEQVKMLWGPVK